MITMEFSELNLQKPLKTNFLIKGVLKIFRNLQKSTHSWPTCPQRPDAKTMLKGHRFDILHDMSMFLAYASHFFFILCKKSGQKLEALSRILTFLNKNQKKDHY